MIAKVDSTSLRLLQNGSQNCDAGRVKAGICYDLLTDSELCTTLSRNSHKPSRLLMSSFRNPFLSTELPFSRRRAARLLASRTSLARAPVTTPLAPATGAQCAAIECGLAVGELVETFTARSGGSVS